MTEERVEYARFWIEMHADELGILVDTYPVDNSFDWDNSKVPLTKANLDKVETDSNKQCKICMEMKKVKAFIPCGHYAACR